MHIAISLKTSMFDVSKESKNPINQIYGESLLKWLKNEVSEAYEITEPDAEDWGWYSYIEWHGRQYMLGASSIFEEVDDPSFEHKWVLQIDEIRSFKERLLGREQMTLSDNCVEFFRSKLESESNIKGGQFV